MKHLFWTLSIILLFAQCESGTPDKSKEIKDTPSLRLPVDTNPKANTPTPPLDTIKKENTPQTAKVNRDSLKAKPEPMDEIVTITTSFGEITLLLYDQTPKHKSNFLKLAKSGFYNGTTFHRIINDFMIQGGDPNSKDENPTNDGQGGPGYTIPAEFRNNLKHVKGALAAARLGDQMNPMRESSGSQFYIVQNAQGTPFLDGSYTVFGQTIKGMDVIDKISVQPKAPGDRPLNNISMSVKVTKMSRSAIIQKYNCASFYKE